jgi:hypothetical protein
MILLFSSDVSATRIPRSIDRASFEKNISIKLSQDPCFGVK